MDTIQNRIVVRIQMRQNTLSAAFFCTLCKDIFSPDMQNMRNMQFPYLIIPFTAKRRQRDRFLCGAFIHFMHHIYRIKCIDIMFRCGCSAELCKGLRTSIKMRNFVADLYARCIYLKTNNVQPTSQSHHRSRSEPPS